ncbi:MAG: permease-like cell division protein FtsX, partial [Bacillota bacterium]|nr:permease-like cell division protein FtsX [Bacillota bacterium]
MFKTLGYSIKEAFKQVNRNKGMSIASIFSITAMLLILAVVLSITININYLTENVKSQFDTVEVFLEDSITQTSAEKIGRSIANLDGVASYEYISKDQAMTEFKTRWGDSAYLLESLSENPLPNSLRVKLADLNYGSAVKTKCQTIKGVEDVRFYADEVNKVIKITNIIEKGALVIILFLVIVSVVVV